MCKYSVRLFHYHAGWRFNGEGRAVSIPQARFDSEKGEATARASSRSCVKSFPTQACVSTCVSKRLLVKRSTAGLHACDLV